ncbi:conserved hypothetical protein [Desulfamplus magnetovallimortis]|uniref:Uncharacterized protein n=1 Tax=Desulfamplus magnetovallimortis TaxID=1246637 RepID=A0A1W1H844_9BACT|nr:hypothetical protein [Desulfamplus magnetovallimortis]SLM28639.1 conserved hypothetical protein [Desulfamplus magnetovallimortis]
MKINIDKNLVEFTPETADEKVKLEALWKTIVDCTRFNKKLVPVGQYVPSQDELARFAIEGEDALNPSKDAFPEAYANEDCRCYCQTCNKYVELKKGDRIPPCCGKLMEVLD